MIANRMKPVFAALALAAALGSSVEAADRHRDRGHGYHRVENSRWDRQGDGRHNRPAEIDRMIGINKSIAHVRRRHHFGDFYGGSVVGYDVRGVGRYVSRDLYWASDIRTGVMPAPKAKIIDVETEMGGNAFASRACAFEAGVCVIRGGN